VQEPLARRMLPRVDRREIAAIFAGGALGTLARAALTEAFPIRPRRGRGPRLASTSRPPSCSATS